VFAEYEFVAVTALDSRPWVVSVFVMPLFHTMSHAVSPVAPALRHPVVIVSASGYCSIIAICTETADGLHGGVMARK
jgi:hypothetical protein